VIATSIASMVSELTRPKSALPANKVSWQVGLADNILYFERNVDMADTYIMLHYVDHARP